MTLNGLIGVILAVTMVVTAQTLLKMGMTRVGPVDRERLRDPLGLAITVWSKWQVILGLGLYVLSAATWIIVLSSVPLSVAYPFLGLSYVGIAAISVTVLGEWLTPAQWIGITLVVIGVITVALSG